MPIEVTMPKLSPTMETGVIAQWLVKVGDQIKEGDVLADIETDKATMQMKSYDDGTIVHIDHAAGEEVALGQRVMVLARKNEDPQKVAAEPGRGRPGEGRGPKPAEKPTSTAAAERIEAAAPTARGDGGHDRAGRSRRRQRPAGGRSGNGRQAAEAAGGPGRTAQGQPAGAEARRGVQRQPGPGARLGPQRPDRPARRRGLSRGSQPPPAPPPAGRRRPVGPAAGGTRRRRPGRPPPRWPRSASPIRGCARRSPSGWSRPSRPRRRST